MSRVTFKGTPKNKIFDNNKNFKIYGFDVNKQEYPYIKFTKFGNATICGDLPELELEFDYEVTADETYTEKYGYRYTVTTIRPVKELTSMNVVSFLSEILTPNQAKTLYDVYPDIIDKVINNEEVDLSKLKGIKEASFAKIKDKIINNYQLLDYVNLFGGTISLSKIQELYQEYSSVEKIEELLHQDPYDFLTRLGGIGFKKADVILKKLVQEERIILDYELQGSPQRCSAAISYVLKENETEGHTKMELRKCYDKVKELVPQAIEHFKQCCLNEARFYFDKVNLIIARRKMYNDEMFISSQILHALEIDQIKWDFDIEKYRNTEDFPLSDEQMNFLKMVLENNITILTAPAGTGKSAATGVLVKMLKDHEISCLLMTPTGRSAKVLKEYAKYPASTIHRALNYNPASGWSDTPVPHDIVIVDEFSMTSIYLMKHILKSIDFTHTKLVIIGDNEQLPPVDAGNLLHDFIHSKIIPTATLSKVFRYGSNGLLTVATDIRLGHKYLTDDNLITIGKNADYVFKRCVDEKIVDEALEIYKKLITVGYNGKIYKPNEIAILSAYNRGEYGAWEISKRVQAILHKPTEDFVEYGSTRYYKNDIIMQIKNDYHCRPYYPENYPEDTTFLITNGETGEVQTIGDYKELGVQFDSEDALIKRMRGHSDEMQLGYSYSIFKSQGGSIKAVILITPRAHRFFLNSNQIYVGVTRTTDVCFHLGLASTVATSLLKKENFNRMTFTQDFLKNNHH